MCSGLGVEDLIYALPTTPMAQAFLGPGHHPLCIVTALYILPGNEPYASNLCSRLEVLLGSARRVSVPVILFSDAPGLENHLRGRGFSSNLIFVHAPLQETMAWKMASRHRWELPATRNPSKDTAPYMILMASKVEFLARAAGMFSTVSCLDIAPEPRMYLTTETLLWLDCGISKLWHDDQCDILDSFLQNIAVGVRKGDRPSTSSSPWVMSPEIEGQSPVKLTCIHWRFCGGLLMCNRMGAYVLCDLFMEEFERTLETAGVLCWELNILAAIEPELMRQAKFTTWKANHDERMLEAWRANV